ncbi:MAG: sugar transferase [Lachnospiraceae bacterium]|nr:sugar transferase [Lachnospiraceae bacterium]
MDKYDQFKRLLRLGIAGLEILIETALFSAVWYIIYNERRWAAFENKGNLMMIGFYLFYLVIFIYMYGGTKYAYYTKGQLILSQTLGSLFANAVMYIQIIMVFGRFPFPTAWPMVALCVADLVVAAIVNQLSDGMLRRLFPPKRLLLVCDQQYRADLEQKLSVRKDLYEISRCVPTSEPLANLQREIQNCDAMMLYGLDESKRNILVKFCYEQSIRVYIAPEISDILLRGADRVHSFDTPFLLLRNAGLSFEQRIAKRAMDIVISAILLVIASPFMLLTAIAIRLEDGGPALYKQERVTIGGRKFFIYKFRSMVVDAEKYGAQFSTKNDSRITKVGHFIRATRLDELPQLLNILKGDMSIVGPRPERQQYIEEFCRETPEFIYRLKVKAGLTGYAQIYGKYNTTPLDKLKLDLMYIESYSILLDIRLIFLTLKIMFTKESTEGVEDGQNHA